MKAIRAFSMILLVLVVAVNSVTMAVARHHARAVGEVVLCTGYGMVSVSVDANGNPTGPMVPCPDCTPTLAALTDDAVSQPGTVQTVTPLAFTLPTLSTAPQRLRLTPQSRAPPVMA